MMNLQQYVMNSSLKLVEINQRHVNSLLNLAEIEESRSHY